MDLAFSARLKDSGTFRIHLVMEHKSAPDPRIHYQLVHYLTGLWIRQIRDGQEPLPVLPVLFYPKFRFFSPFSLKFPPSLFLNSLILLNSDFLFF